jgi:predicted nucleic acid binding AN1-type Zn finger protein
MTISKSVDSKKKRCAQLECKKKLSMIEREFVCLCGNCFCTKHRLPEDHCCRHNFSETPEKREQKSEALKCVASKVIKI